MENIDKLFQEFMWECEFTQKLQPETLKGYRDVFGLFKKLNPGLQFEDINPYTVTRFFKTLHERKRVYGKGTVKVGIRKSTVATYWGRLNGFFSWLEKRNYLQGNPFRRMKYPSPVYEDQKYLKKEDVEKIFAAIDTHHGNSLLVQKRNILMFNVLLFCGLRKEELLLLRLTDIDIGRKLLTVRGENSKSGVVRQVPLTSSTITVLRDYLTYRKKYTTQYLFVSSTSDKELSYDGMKHLVEKLNDRSKVRFHLHQFRHTFAMNFLKQSNNIYKLQQLMGHKSIQMTAVYLRRLPAGEMRDDIEKMNIENLI